MRRHPSDARRADRRGPLAAWAGSAAQAGSASWAGAASKLVGRAEQWGPKEAVGPAGSGAGVRRETSASDMEQQHCDDLNAYVGADAEQLDVSGNP